MGPTVPTVLPNSLSPAAVRWLDVLELTSFCGRSWRAILAGRTARLGISDSQFALLWACREAPPDGLSQIELVEALAVSPYTGELLSRQPLPGRGHVAPIVAGGTLYLLADNAELIALR